LSDIEIALSKKTENSGGLNVNNKKNFILNS